MDNQRLIIWGFFAVMAYLTWQTYTQQYGAQPTPVPPVAEEAALAADDIAGLPELDTDTDTDTEELPSMQAAPDAVSAGAANESAIEASSIIVVTTDVFEIEINTRGGTLQSATMHNFPVAKDTPDKKIQMLNTDPSDLGVIRSWLRNKEGSAPDANTLFNATTLRFDMNGEDELVVPMTWTDANGVEFEKRYTFTRGNYGIEMQLDVKNNSDSEWRGDLVTQLLRRSYELERSMFDVDSYSFDGAEIFDGEKAQKLKRDDLQDDGPFSFTSDNGWYASIQHHFLSAIVPAPESTNIYQVRIDGNRLTASVISAPQAAKPGETISFEKLLFVGPKLQSQLDPIHPKLKLTVDYGWLVIL
jgi:YidC/Oxa1 family membrane protein insertase